MSSFKSLGGVEIMGYISPVETNDTYAVIDPLYGIDGLRNVKTIEELNHISTERRRAGMIVGVNGGANYYKLRDIAWTNQITDWFEIYLGGVTHIDKEKPTGVIDGVNATFTLQYTPILNSEHLFLNGMLQDEEDDYTISGSTIVFFTPPMAYPHSNIKCSYRTI